MKAIAALPSSSMFLIGMTKADYQREMAPLLEILRVQHQAQDVGQYVSYPNEVKDQFNLMTRVQADEASDEIEEIGHFLRNSYNLSRSDFDIYFLVNRSLTRAFAVRPDFPLYAEQNNFNNPFVATDIQDFETLVELSTLPMTYQERAVREGDLDFSEFGVNNRLLSLKKYIDKKHESQTADSVILAELHWLFSSNVISDADYETLNLYLGYEMEEAWNHSSWAVRLCLPLGTLDDWQIKDHFDREMAKEHIREDRLKGFSTAQILGMYGHQYLHDALDYESFKLIASLLRKPLPAELDTMPEDERVKAIKQFISR
ncbi:MAG: hypothetical protein LKM30_02830 [Bacilli bacterium]|jgi:hypothetical protein|nr:hypothetical protein [Bacilli bacterium]